MKNLKTFVTEAKEKTWRLPTGTNKALKPFAELLSKQFSNKFKMDGAHYNFLYLLSDKDIDPDELHTFISNTFGIDNENFYVRSRFDDQENKYKIEISLANKYGYDDANLVSTIVNHKSLSRTGKTYPKIKIKTIQSNLDDFEAFLRSELDGSALSSFTIAKDNLMSALDTVGRQVKIK